MGMIDDRESVHNWNEFFSAHKLSSLLSQLAGNKYSMVVLNSWQRLFHSKGRLKNINKWNYKNNKHLYSTYHTQTHVAEYMQKEKEKFHFIFYFFQRQRRKNLFHELHMF